MSMTFYVEDVDGEEDYVNMSNSNAHMIWNTLGLPIEDFYWKGTVGQVLMASLRALKTLEDTDSLFEGGELAYRSLRLTQIKDLCLKATDPNTLCSLG